MENVSGLEIAVIGMAGKFPGAPDIRRFWENLKAGIESITFLSVEELEELGVPGEMTGDPNYVNAASLLDNVQYFDAAFFGYTPMEAELMAPQIRLFHECTWHALEDAGYVPHTHNDMYGAAIGLYAGASTSAHWEALAFLSGKREAFGDFATNLLADKDQLATRVSYNLNLRGPSFTLATACSSSLVAIHLACQGLLSGECRMAAAGGVTVSIPRNYGYLYQQGGILSSDGHCKAFDADSDGAVLGEGCGVVILKPLEDALEDRDHIYALIKGSAINNDGSGKVGYTAPGARGQADVIRAALQAAGVGPESITYVETHGTGTRMGDPIEIEALSAAFNTSKNGFCRIGTVKSNVGHLVHAAGVAGFIKTVLALKYRLLPPSLFFNTPNPQIPFQDIPFEVNTGLTPWESTDGPLRAGVSSFGIGGTNAHVVLEEWPRARNSGSGIGMAEKRGQIAEPAQRHHLLLLSARSAPALERMTRNLADHFKENPFIDLADAAYTLKLGRMAFPFRRMAVCANKGEAAHVLNTDSRKLRSHRMEEGKKTVIFMFPGLGSQYVDMGRGLYESEPLFREAADRCFRITSTLLDYDVQRLLYPPGNDCEQAEREFDLNRPHIAQMAVFILEYALARMLMSWGIRPDVMIGYSFGEYTAACISGVFSLEDSLGLIAARGELIDSLPPGAMLSVPLPAAEIKPMLDRELSVAIDNGPSCIVAGPGDALAAFQGVLKEQKHLCLKLPNSHALHSPMMAPIAAPFEEYLCRIEMHEPQIPYISNVTALPVTRAQAADPVFWGRHLQETVRFAEGVDALMKKPNPIFIEIGPGRDLSTMLARHRQLKETEAPVYSAFSLIRPQAQDIPDNAFLLDKVGRLWLRGIPVDWNRFYRGQARCRVPLPLYPFEGKPFWITGTPAPLADGMAFPNPLPRTGTTDTIAAETGSYDRPELSSEYALPGDDVERDLVDLWQEIFGIRPIGVHDDFFELGGDSLLATTMISRLQRDSGFPVPLAEVFDRPTVKQLAAFCRRLPKASGAAEGPGENLVFLKCATAPDAPNLFCIHDISGRVEGYVEFINRLQLDLNFWGLKTTGITALTPENRTVPQMAESYLEAVRSMQPRGPYYFVGWSFGGFVGFEMVRMLERLGETVGFFSCVDAFLFKDEVAGTSGDFTLENELEWLQDYLPEHDSELKKKIAGVTEFQHLWPLIADHLDRAGGEGRTLLRGMLPDNMSAIIPNFKELSAGQLIGNLNLLRTFNHALACFAPSGKIRTPLHFFKAARPTWEIREDHWSDCRSTEEPVNFYDVPGDHFSIFRTPDVTGLADRFGNAFKKVLPIKP